MPMFTMKKKNAMKIGGMIASRSRGTARSARPAIANDVVERARPVAPGRRRARCAGRMSNGDVGGGHDWSSSASKWAPVSSRNTSSSVGVRSVRSRTRIDASWNAMAIGPIADEPSSTLMVSSWSRPSTPTTPYTPCSACLAASTSPSMRATTTSVPMLRFSSVGVPSATSRAAVDDADAVGELVGLLEVLRGEQDGHAQLVVEPLHLLPHAGAADRVEPGGRLVEEQHVGVVHQRGGEVEPATHAARVGVDAPVERVAEVDQRAELDQPLVDLLAGEPVELALQAQQLDAGLLRVEGDVLQRDADAEAHLLRPLGDVEARHRRLPAGGREQRAEHLHRGRLAGAVGSEQAVDLAPRDGEVEVVDRGDVAEGADEALGR